MATQKRLYRSEKDRVIAGVCGGLAEYLDMDPVIVRLIFLVGTFIGFGSFFWVYIIMWLFVPTESEVEKTSNEVMRNNMEEMKGKVKKVAEEVKDTMKSKKEEK